MLNITKIGLLIPGLLLILVPVSFAQQVQPVQTPKPEPDYVTEKNFKSKIFEVKYRDPDNLARVLRQLGSGFKGSAISSNLEFKTITVRDFPENLVTMEEAIKRLDTPAPPSPNLELHMHVLLASNTSTNTNVQVPNELKDVLTQLRETLSYRNYELAASIIQRLAQTPFSLSSSGIAEISATGSERTALPYDYQINSVSLMANGTGPSVHIGQFTFFTSSESARARIQTALNIRDGEKVVVGTATIGNRALVVVLTAKVVK